MGFHLASQPETNKLRQTRKLEYPAFGVYLNALQAISAIAPAGPHADVGPARSTRRALRQLWRFDMSVEIGQQAPDFMARLYRAVM